MIRELKPVQVSQSGLNFSTYTTDTNTDGWLEKVWIETTTGSVIANGSLFLTISGTNETLLTMTGVTGADLHRYPRVKLHDSAGNNFSLVSGGNVLGKFPLTTEYPIQIVGSAYATGSALVTTNFHFYWHK